MFLYDGYLLLLFILTNLSPLFFPIFPIFFFYHKKRELSPPLQLVDISKLVLNSKIKKFSYSFICGKGYSPPNPCLASR